MSLPLAARKNIKEKESKRDDNLARIEKATGQKYTFEVDISSIHNALAAAQKDRVGTHIYDSYLTPLADNIEKLCKDDMSKEAFVDATKTRKITLIPDGQKSPSYHPICSLEGGVLTIYVNDNKDRENFPSNCNETGGDLEKLL